MCYFLTQFCFAQIKELKFDHALYYDGIDNYNSFYVLFDSKQENSFFLFSCLVRMKII